MRRHVVAMSAALALVSGVAACGGSDEQPAAKPAVAVTTPTASPTPGPQPKGADGVTYDILNWEDHADDPAVLAWKRTSEAVGASINDRTTLPAMREGLSARALRTYQLALDSTEKYRQHVPAVGKVKIRSARTTGPRARLIVCAWLPSVEYYDENDKAVGTGPNRWVKQDIGMRSRSGTWVLDTISFEGDCPGGPPA